MRKKIDSRWRVSESGCLSKVVRQAMLSSPTRHVSHTMLSFRLLPIHHMPTGPPQTSAHNSPHIGIHHVKGTKLGEGRKKKKKKTHRSNNACTLGSAKSLLTLPNKPLTSSSRHPSTPVYSRIDRPSSPLSTCARFHAPTSLSVASRAHPPMGTRNRRCTTRVKPAAATQPRRDEPGLGSRPRDAAAPVSVLIQACRAWDGVREPSSEW